MAEYADLHRDLRALLRRVDGLVESPAPIEALNLSDTLAAPVKRMAFAVDIQSSDTGLERQATLMRIEHVVRVQLLVRLRQHGQWSSTIEQAYDTEQAVVSAMLTVRDLPSYRTRYLASTRELVGDGAYLLVSMQFSCTGTVATGRN